MNPTLSSGSSQTAGSPGQQVTKQNRSLPDTVCILIVSLMMGCVALSVAQVGERLDSSWDGSYLVVLAVLVSLEALLTARMFSDTSSLSPEWFLYRGVEWVVLLVGIRLYIFAWSLLSLLLGNGSLMDHPLSFRIINLDVIVGVVTGLVIWVLASVYSSALTLLEYDKNRLDTEREGIGMLDRGQVRKQLMALVFTVGGVMLGLTALLRLDPVNFRLLAPADDGRHWNLLVYFLLGLLLLGITNFSALRSRWYIQKIHLASNLSRRWIVLSLILLSLIAVVAVLLPTRYAVDILALIEILIRIGMSILGFLYLLLLSPLLFLLNQLLRLLRPVPVEGEPVNPIPTLPMPPPSDRPPIPWVDFLQSVLFWALLIGVIGFSLYHYTQQRKDWVQSVKKVSVFGWLQKLWRWIAQGFMKANRHVTAALAEAAQRTAGFFQGRRSKRSSLGPVPLTPKEKVIYIYQSLIHQNQDTNVPRLSHQTPQEYGHVLQDTLPEVQPEINSLTDIFMDARYSQHTIAPDQANQASDWVETIRRAVEERMKEKMKKDTP